MAKKTLLRKPKSRRCGIKVLCMGDAGVGKSLYGLSFPEVAVLDSENKVYVYENHEEYGKNIVGILDTSTYSDTMELLNEIINNPTECKTLCIDSETMVYKNLQLSILEADERRAIKKNQDLDSTGLSVKSWGRIKYLNERLTLAKTQLSANGVNLITIAHKVDVMQQVGSERVKVGEKADLGKGNEFTYDVILRFFKEKDLATGEYVFKAEVIKDTTSQFKVGEIIINPSYENTFKDYLEKLSHNETLKVDYGNSLENSITEFSKEGDSFDEVRDEFVSIYKSSDSEQKDKIKALLKEHDCAKYNDIANFDKLKVVLETIKSW